jgi:epoxide hydrolase-like predicted phosphatase
MTMKKTLLLDVMSTLVYDPFFIEVPAFFGMTLKELLVDKHPTAWLEFERNEIAEKEFFRKFFGDARYFDGEKMKSCMERNYRFLPGIEELLADLKSQGVPMYALSNYPHWYKLIEEKLELSRYLEWRFVSCDTGFRKPDPRAYTTPLELLGLQGSDCIFVDDRGSNCKAAVAQGMAAIKFENSKQLRNQLLRLNVLEEQ